MSDSSSTPLSNDQKLQEALKKSFPDALVQTTDMTGQNNHFEVRIISEDFRGKKLIEQHKMVYAALGELLDGPIHAVELKTVAPD